MLALSQADATVITGFFALIGVMASVIGVQIKVHADNRSDHAATSEKVDTIISNQREIRQEVHYIRSEVSDIHGSIVELRHADRDIEDRVTIIERPPIVTTQTTNTEVVTVTHEGIAL